MIHYIDLLFLPSPRGTSKPQEAPQLLHLVLLLPAELHPPILAPLQVQKIFFVRSLEIVFKTYIQVALVMDMEKAAATIIEEEEEEGLLMVVVVVVALQVTSIEVEEIGEAGHRNRDPKGGTF